MTLIFLGSLFFLYVLNWLITLLYLGWLKNKGKYNYKFRYDYDEAADSTIFLSFIGLGFISIIFWLMDMCEDVPLRERFDGFIDKFASLYEEKPDKSVNDLSVEELELLVKQKKGEE